MNATAQQERRSFQRLPANARVQIECRRSESTSGPNLAAGVLDVSQSGVRLALSSPVETGESLRLSLLIAGEPMPVRVVAVVRWQNGAEAGVELQRPLRKTDVANLT